MKSKVRFVSLLSASFLLFACGQAASNPFEQKSSTPAMQSEMATESQIEDNPEIREVYRLYVEAGGSLSYEDWLNSIKGEAGTSLLSGRGAPSVNLGHNGDSYIDIDTWNFFAKENGQWTLMGNLKAPSGEAGEKGEAGLPGEKGDQGEAGENGKSAYEIYKDAHPEYLGDEAQWMDDLVNGRLAGESSATYHTVTFDLGYDSESFTQTVEDGKKATKPADPIRNGYDFLDWVDINHDHWVFNGYSITSDITLYAVWSDPIDYEVKFLNNDGTELYSYTAHYGDVAAYQGDTPVAADQDTHFIYSFAGWDKSLTVTGDMTFTAQYSTVYIATTAYYYDEDGVTLLASVPLAEGEEPHYVGTNPSKARDKINKLQYEFVGWEKSEETADTIKFIAKYAACTDGLDIENGVVTYYHGTSTDVVIPSTWNGIAITRIGESAFAGKATLKSITMPQSITAIGENAFRNCSSLTGIELHEGITSIGINAFYECFSLKSITIPNGITSIEGTTFCGCRSLESVQLPESLTEIGSSAFSQCSSLKSLELPNALERIGAWAFQQCSSLKRVFLASSIKNMDRGVFDDCSPSLVICTENEYKPVGWSAVWNETWDNGPTDPYPVVWGYEKDVVHDGITYAIGEVDGDKYACAIGYDGVTADVVIPEEVDGATVNQMCNALFEGSTTLHSITIQAAIASGPRRLFCGCSSLTSAVLPEGLTSIGDSAFCRCGSLASINLPEILTSIGSEAFYECKSLISITLPESLTSIGDNAFYDCGHLQSIDIPASVEQIGLQAFWNCTGLSYIKFHSELPPQIGDNLLGFVPDPASFKIYVPTGSLEAYQAITASGWQGYALDNLVEY